MFRVLKVFTLKTKEALLSLYTKQAVLSELYKSENRRRKREEDTEKKAAVGLDDCYMSLPNELF